MAYAVGKSNCSRNCGTLHHTRVSSHLQFVYFGLNHVRRRCIVPLERQPVGVHQWQHIEWDGAKIREYNHSLCMLAKTNIKTRTWDGSEGSCKLTLKTNNIPCHWSWSFYRNSVLIWTMNCSWSTLILMNVWLQRWESELMHKYWHIGTWHSSVMPVMVNIHRWKDDCCV